MFPSIKLSLIFEFPKVCLYSILIQIYYLSTILTIFLYERHSKRIAFVRLQRKARVTPAGGVTHVSICKVYSIVYPIPIDDIYKILPPRGFVKTCQ